MRACGIKAAVVYGNGINCESETAHVLRLAGFNVELVLFRKLINDPAYLSNFQILVLPGGFSYGDQIGAGCAMGAMIRGYMKSTLDDFLNKGNLMVGICNGCQIMVNSGLVPGNTRIALGTNKSGNYECRWVYARATKKSVWFDEGEVVYVPVAHKEGQFTFADDQTVDSNIALRYCDEHGNFAQGKYPINPNGSKVDVAAITNKAGNAIGIMPHPERGALTSQMFFNNHGVTDTRNLDFFRRMSKALY